MSTVTFNSNQQNVQDLLAALPSPESQSCRWCETEPSKDSKPGFKDLLRESSDTQQSRTAKESPEQIDTQPQSESQQESASVSDKPEQTDQPSQTEDAQDDSSQETAESETTEQSGEQSETENNTGQAEESAEEAELQAAANAASAQLNVVEAVTTDQPKVQAQSSSNQQVDLTQVKVADSNEKAEAQKQSGVSSATLNAALPNQAQSASGPVTQEGSVQVVQPTLQPGEQSQTNSGDTRGESKAASAAAAATTGTSTTSNASAASSFTVPDQVSSDARLPINPTSVTQTADAARQAQAQAAVTTGNNDALNTARLTRGLANAVQQRGGAVTLRLTPPEMGTVRIQMQITGTNVSASFHAESASAQTLLTTQLAQLRSSLESKGMSVERLSVQPLAATAQSNNANQSQNQSDGQQQGQSQQQSTGDGRSRGQYNGGSSGQSSSDQPQDNSPGQQAPRGFFDRLNDATSETDER